MTQSGVKKRPGHKAVRVDSDGSSWIEGFRCVNCNALAPERTLACRCCGSRTSLEPFSAAQTGKLYSWTVVHRSYPGIAVPFVSAIVDLADGLALKGTLRDANIQTLRPGLPVRVIFDDAGGASDSDGRPYVGFHFTPEENSK